MAGDVIDLINAVYEPKKKKRRPGGPRKLDALDVTIIRDRAKRGVPQKNLAKFFCVSPSLISKIVNGRTWRHVNPDDDRPSDIGTWRMVS